MDVHEEEESKAFSKSLKLNFKIINYKDSDKILNLWYHVAMYVTFDIKKKL